MATTALCLAVVGCVFGPDVNPVIQLDLPPFIEPTGVRPNPEQEPVVAFNLADEERARSFQANAIYDININDRLTHAFVIQIGDFSTISVPPANLPRFETVLSANQDQPLFSRYESQILTFDPCGFGEIAAGLATSGTIQLIVYDRIPENQRTDPSIEEYTVRWVWPVTFSGQCPI